MKISRAFGHVGHEDWCRQTMLNMPRHVPLSKAARFTDEKDNQARRDQSPGPGTGNQLTSFMLPDIHRGLIMRDAANNPLNPNFVKYNRSWSINLTYTFYLTFYSRI